MRAFQQFIFLVDVPESSYARNEGHFHMSLVSLWWKRDSNIRFTWCSLFTRHWIREIEILFKLSSLFLRRVFTRVCMKNQSEMQWRPDSRVSRRWPRFRAWKQFINFLVKINATDLTSRRKWRVKASRAWPRLIKTARDGRPAGRRRVSASGHPLLRRRRPSPLLYSLLSASFTVLVLPHLSVTSPCHTAVCIIFSCLSWTFCSS